MKKIAYLVLVHNDPDHLLRLIDAINFNCDIYIHIDYKANLDDFRELKKYDNIYFCESRKNICWGGFNMVLAMKELIKMSLNKNKDYSHLVFLSGSDYPIKNKEEIYEYLPYIHTCLVMTVEPGKGGQTLITDMLAKISTLKAYVEKNNIEIDIEVDGGVNIKTAPRVKEAGADILVAGTAILKANNFASIIDELREIEK